MTVSLLFRVGAHVGNDSNPNPLSPQEAGPRLGDALEARDLAWEEVLSLGSPEVVEAGHRWAETVAAMEGVDLRNLARIIPAARFKGEYPVPDLPEYLQESFVVLRRAYPHGVPQEDYTPLLAALWEEMSNRNLADLVAAVTDDEPMGVYNDASGAVSDLRPPEADIERVRAHLLASGWIPEDEGPPLE